MMGLFVCGGFEMMPEIRRSSIPIKYVIYNQVDVSIMRLFRQPMHFYFNIVSVM